MTEVLRVAHPLWSEENLKWHLTWGKERSGREDRGIEEIESEFGERFFEEYLTELITRFPNAEPFEILEGGCGQCKGLGDLKKRMRMMTNRSIRTTGVSLQESHIEYAMQNNVDELILGPVDGHNFTRRYHFILDHRGAAYYAFGKVIPVYSKILIKRGLGVISYPFVAGQNDGLEILKKNRFRYVRMLEDYGVVNGTRTEEPRMSTLVEKK